MESAREGYLDAISTGMQHAADYERSAQEAAQGYQNEVALLRRVGEAAVTLSGLIGQLVDVHNGNSQATNRAVAQLEACSEHAYTNIIGPDYESGVNNEGTAHIIGILHELIHCAGHDLVYDDRRLTEGYSYIKGHAAHVTEFFESDFKKIIVSFTGTPRTATVQAERFSSMAALGGQLHEVLEAKRQIIQGGE